MRTLILTGSESEGQQVVARALKQAFTARGDTSLALSARVLLGQHPPLSYLKALENEALASPRGFAFLSAGAAFLREGKRKSTVYAVNARYAEHLETLLREGEFDAVLCLHRYPAEAVSHIRKTLAFSARCCFLSCDYACVPFLEETRLDHYFTAHGSLTAAYEARGIPAKKIIPAGIPLPSDWFCAEDRVDARAILNLPQGMPCYYIPAASDPEAATVALLSRIRGENGRVCVVSPDGAPPKSPFVARFSGDIRVVVLSGEDSHALYCAACDVVLCSPSGALSTRAALSGIPLVHLPTADSFEAQTACFFAAQGMSALAGNYDEAATLAVSLAKDGEKQEQMRSRQQSESIADGAKHVVRFLHEGRL